MSMTPIAARVVPLILACSLIAGCASGRATPPRPRPFPGASLPPVSPDPAPITPPATTTFTSPLIATALSLRGLPYVNGGSDPSRGFDCSGFVQWVFAQHGAVLPREAREQYEEGLDVDRDQVQPGDLVFFETVSRGASHVGIALGRGEFVHAPSSRGVVRIEQYTSGYWRNRWVGARRVEASKAPDNPGN